MDELGRKERAYPSDWENGATIDLGAIVHNYRTLEAHCGVPVTCVLKANAYGHGLAAVYDALRRAGAVRFALANFRETQSLGKRAEGTSLLILGNTSQGHMKEAQAQGISCTLFGEEQWQEMKEILDPSLPPLGVQIKVDTGFHRLGFSPERSSLAVIEEILRHPSVRVEGVYSHLALAEEERDKEQLRRLTDFLQMLEEAGFSRKSLGDVHIADSISAIEYPWARLDGVRIGAALFGLGCERPAYAPLGLRPAMALWSRVSQLRNIREGEGVGYDRAFVADKDMRIATLALGYGDGYPRRLSCGGGKVWVCGHLAPVLGLICMDQVVVDVTEIPGVKRGDVALAWETEVDSPVSLWQVAAWAHSNKNEIAAGLTGRVPRQFLEMFGKD